MATGVRNIPHTKILHHQRINRGYEKIQFSTLFCSCLSWYSLLLENIAWPLTHKVNLKLEHFIFNLKRSLLFLNICKRKIEVCTINVSLSQCGNFRICLLLRFYVKSISRILEVQKMPFLPFRRLLGLNLNILCHV